MKDYIGDGVYAAWDGNGIILTLDQQDNSRIVLESSTWISLLRFVERIKEESA